MNRDITGLVTGRLTVVGFAHKKRNTPYWNCRCECGGTATCSFYDLTRKDNKRSRSCGCLVRERIIEVSTTHGATSGRKQTPEYRVWASVIARCNNPNSTSYPRYGGRGIKICERWYRFENFLEDMGTRPVGYSIERVDNLGHYEPSNCVWATPKQQARNRRNNRIVTAFGESLTVAEWAERTGIKQETIHYRVKHGVSAEMALTAPVRRGASSSG